MAEPSLPLLLSFGVLVWYLTGVPLAARESVRETKNTGFVTGNLNEEW